VTHPSQAPLRLHIGTLALPGMSRVQGERIGAALRQELAQLLASDAMIERLSDSVASRALATTVALDGGNLRLRRNERPERTGRRLAQRLAQSLLIPAAPPQSPRAPR
jgi:hypothetical protein